MKLTKSITYVVVTPVRDEASNIHHTIESFANQTILPKQWVVIDDGSTDATGQIADEAARKYPWITVIHRRNRGFRKTGGGVIEAFYDGYELVRDQSWDFIAKMDADLGFAADYFERCFEIFEKDPKLGGSTNNDARYRYGKGMADLVNNRDEPALKDAVKWFLAAIDWDTRPRATSPRARGILRPLTRARSIA